MSESILYEQSEEIVSMFAGLARRVFTLEADDPGMEMPVAQMRVCAVLVEAPKTMGAISRELGISTSAITQIADRLERTGMVERIMESDDRRCKRLRLTELGHDKMRSRRERRVSRMQQAMDKLLPEDRVAVVSALRKLFDAGLAVEAESASTPVATEQLVS